MKVPGSHVIRQGDHRTGLALEVEGYEIRDCVHVVTTSGVEMWWVARWPVEGTVTSNVLKHGVGALNIDGCRLSWFGATPSQETWNAKGRSVGSLNIIDQARCMTDSYAAGHVQVPSGRWPPNLIFLHAEGCVRVGEKKVKGITGGSTVVRQAMPYEQTKGMYTSGRQQPEPVRHLDADGKETVPAYVCAPGCSVATLDEMSGVLTTGAMSASVQRGKLGGHGVYGSSDGSGVGQAVEASSGGASRFFPCFESKEELVEWISRLVGLQTGVE